MFVVPHILMKYFKHTPFENVFEQHFLKWNIPIEAYAIRYVVSTTAFYQRSSINSSLERNFIPRWRYVISLVILTHYGLMASCGVTDFD